ncbi:nucleotidyl transferase AbiEii/AbiGii toxin family protein [Rhizobium laguerreae]|uniref:nucleotidyl transferase AbiEii/AbiGii toxin family protein n=1 Tax=Rhizobium TaxID=379 RepID=UPI000B1D2B1F|nr:MULTISPECIES: nucleotidyl transferase AbiEii/AbiGii toxin family protein [Rhizobium]MBY3102237.1 nucleotidyl transferase AbiEii/AbiGii toxin family protein [Rhizobium laguerreae]MBY3129811.1 nucleotidyl transferase AbiEii/AbiGii toxin family protein [Rhizobium laguerreae]
MPTKFFELDWAAQERAINFASNELNQAPHILEKDVWVVWVLDAVFRSAFSDVLSFKGGTSLSKAYGLIDRFSEDVDLTYDIRQFLPGMNFDEDGIPPNRSQQNKLSKAARDKLPEWIKNELAPVLAATIEKDGLRAKLVQGDNNETLNVDFESHFAGHSYVRSSVLLEFGARSTGEPTVAKNIECYAQQVIPAVAFPSAVVRTMKVERTFWEKATAAHVYSHQEDLKKERFSRHWHDLHYIFKSDHWDAVRNDKEIARKVAVHKSFFFAEKDKSGNFVDYTTAVAGNIRIIPEGTALQKLRDDYVMMQESQIVREGAPAFDEILESCAAMEKALNS